MWYMPGNEKEKIISDESAPKNISTDYLFLSG